MDARSVLALTTQYVTAALASVVAAMAIAGDMLREFWSDDKDQNWRRAVLEVATGDRDVAGELLRNSMLR